MDNEYVTIKMKNEDLNDSLRRAIEQRDLARSEILTLYTKLQQSKEDKEDMADIFHGMSNLYLIFYQISRILIRICFIHFDFTLS